MTVLTSYVVETRSVWSLLLVYLIIICAVLFCTALSKHNRRKHNIYKWEYKDIKQLATFRGYIDEKYLIEQCGLTPADAARMYGKLLAEKVINPDKQNTKHDQQFITNEQKAPASPKPEQRQSEYTKLVQEHDINVQNKFPVSSIPPAQNRPIDHFAQPLPGPSADWMRRETALAVREHEAYIRSIEANANSQRMRPQHNHFNSISIYEIDNMSGWQFEELIEKLFIKMGYSARRTKLTGDQGVDVIACRGNKRIAIQTKCYKNQNAGNSAVQEVVAGMRIYDANDAYVITNQYYTKSARELAHSNGVTLWDRDDLEAALEKFW